MTVSVAGDFVSHSLIDSIWNWKRNCRWACVTTVEEFRQDGGRQHQVIYELAGWPPTHTPTGNLPPIFPEFPKHRHQHWHSPSTTQFSIEKTTNCKWRLECIFKADTCQDQVEKFLLGIQDSRIPGTAAPWPVTNVDGTRPIIPFVCLPSFFLTLKWEKFQWANVFLIWLRRVCVTCAYQTAKKNAVQKVLPT